MKYMMLVMLLIITQNVFCQPNAKTIKRRIRKGDKIFYSKKPDYTKALNIYRDIYPYAQNNPALNYKIGRCIFEKSMLKALPYLKKADSAWTDDNDSLSIENNSFLLSEHYYFQMNIDSAIFFLKKTSEYTNDKTTKININTKILNLLHLDSIKKSPQKILIDKPQTSINTDQQEYYPILYNNDTKLLCNHLDDENQNDIKIYNALTLRHTVDKLKIPNLKLEDVICDMSKNGNYVLICRNNDIYISIADNDGYYGRPEKLPAPINTRSNETFACIDDNYIYFVSDRQGGKGGKDIYRIRYIAKNKNIILADKEENLKTLNSQNDEMALSLQSYGNGLYLISNRSGGLGGYDIYHSLPDENDWYYPENMGYPMNTTQDELFYTSLKNSNIGGFMTRKTDVENIDVLKVEIPKFDYEFVFKEYDDVMRNTTLDDDLRLISFEDEIAVNINIVTSIIGTITDDVTGAPVRGDIKVYDKVSNDIVAAFSPSDNDGSFTVSLLSGENYVFMVNDNVDYLFSTAEVPVPQSFESGKTLMNITMSQTRYDSVYTVPGIFFHDDEVDTKASLAFLNRIFNAMWRNNNLLLDIIGDERKIHSVMKVLHDIGVDEHRLNAIVEKGDIRFRIRKN